MRRPSPAFILSLIALMCSLGGSAYAAGLIDGKTLKKRSVSGAKLRKNTLGGKEIKEARLGKVPQAARADSAASAAGADRAATAGRADSALRADSAASADSAATLGGTPAASFVQGGGRNFSVTRVIAPAQGSVTDVARVPGFARLDGNCAGGLISFSMTDTSGQDFDRVKVAFSGTSVDTSGGSYLSGSQITAVTGANGVVMQNIQLVRRDGAIATFTLGAVPALGECRFTLQGAIS